MALGLIFAVVEFPKCCKDCKFFTLRQGGMNDRPSSCLFLDSYDWAFDGKTKFENCPIAPLTFDAK